MTHRSNTQLRFLTLLVVFGLVVAVCARIAFARSKAAPIGTGVVVIDTNLGYEESAAAGSGMVLTSSGEVLTNNHVIDGATTIKVVVPGTDHRYTAHVVGYDKSADVALLSLQNASGLKTVSLGDSSKLSVGQAVKALGNANGTGRLTPAPGTITGLGKSIVASDDEGSSERLTGLIETNAGLIPGDSGGPLFDNAGHVIGMDTAASTSQGYAFQDVSSTAAFAIPIDKAVTLAKAIEGGRSSSTVHVGATAFFGIRVEPAGESGGFGDVPATGALIVGVVQGGPAAAAGLVAGDVVTAVAGKAVTTPTGLTSVVLAEKPGVKVGVSYVDQAGEQQTATVTLGSGPPQ